MNLIFDQIFEEDEKPTFEHLVLGPHQRPRKIATDLFDSFRIFRVRASFTSHHWSAAANWQHIQIASVFEDLFWLEPIPVEWMSGCVGLLNGDKALCVWTKRDEETLL